jgi:hypothetical protein
VRNYCLQSDAHSRTPLAHLLQSDLHGFREEKSGDSQWDFRLVKLTRVIREVVGECFFATLLIYDYRKQKHDRGIFRLTLTRA